MEKVSTEVIKLTDNSEYQNDSQESRKSQEKPGENKISIEEKKMQDFNSEFPEHSQNSQTESAVKIFKMKFDEEATETRTLFGDSECREDSRKSRTNTCVEITEHENLKEIRLPLKPKQLQQLQKNDTYCRDVSKKLHKDKELQKIFIKEKGVLYRLWTEDGRTFKCILVPEVLQDSMIILAHDYSGHNGSRRTNNCLKRQYYWPGIQNRFSDTARNVRSVYYKTKDSQKNVSVILTRQICRWNSSAWTWWDPFIHQAAGERSMY